MSKQEHKTDVSARTPLPITREQFERERLTRRGLLRRVGITAGASLFSLVAIDDVVRATVTKMRETEALRGVADAVAVEFRNAGVAFAQGSGNSTPCNVTAIPCYKCPSGPDGGPPPPCTEPFCQHCTPPSDCDDCMAVAEYRYCNCMQIIINSNPDCFTNGVYNGQCSWLAVPLQRCADRRTSDEGMC